MRIWHNATIPVLLGLFVLGTPEAHGQKPQTSSVQQAVQAQAQKAAAAQQKAQEAAMQKRGVTRMQELPQDFPLPVYSHNASGSSFYRRALPQGGVSISVSTQTKDEASAVCQWYSDAMSKGGWQMKQSGKSGPQQAPGAYLLQGTKDPFTAFIMCTRLGTDSTAVNVSVARK